MPFSSDRYEQLGQFFLGAHVDPTTGEPSAEPLLLDARDLRTHCAIVGMTGSGKTGLGVCLLEEAALDGVPALVVDLKGDLTNLCLTFPELAPEDFQPWVDPAAAQREGITVETLAARTATTWQDGLARWGQYGDRIARLRARTDLRILTPGAPDVAPLSVLDSLAPPKDPGGIDDQVDGTVSSLFALLGEASEGVQSSAHVYLSALVARAWQAGETLSLADLIQQVQRPPMATLGVLPVDEVMPERDRTDLAVQLNNLLAAPSFGAWRTGPPLDVARLLANEDGHPCLSVLYLAHLSDEERMFFLTLLLAELIGWMRRQRGTSSLRALLYIDEVFGYLPPVANPPSKRLLLTLMKQARAFGLGVVLSTQNPVDLDYKALSNAGTWMVGRLQTDRDLDRLMDGLKQAGQETVGALRDTIAGQPTRSFVMKQAGEATPVRFSTRWALSYLPGPLTLAQLDPLVDPGDRVASERESARIPPEDTETAPSASVPAEEAVRPLLPAGVEETFLGDAGQTLVPHVAASVRLHFKTRDRSVNRWERRVALARVDEGNAERVWDETTWLKEGALEAAAGAPTEGTRLAPVPPALLDDDTYDDWQHALKQTAYETVRLKRRTCPALDLEAEPGESEAAFRVQLRQAVRERRDQEVDRLREDHAEEVEQLRDKLAKASARVEREEGQYTSEKMEAVLQVGASLLQLFTGGSRSRTSGLRRTVRDASQAFRERSDTEAARREVEALHRELADLEAELEKALEAARNAWTPDAMEIAVEEIGPLKGDLDVGTVRVVWRPATAAA